MRVLNCFHGKVVGFLQSDDSWLGFKSWPTWKNDYSIKQSKTKNFLKNQTYYIKLERFLLIRWILQEESEVSGLAVLEIQIPSGYGLVQSDAINLVSSGVHPTLRDSLMESGKTSWYFDFVSFIVFHNLRFSLL